ncbi:hypothetical protein GE061_007829 [Apolygus lucorum]|uniref:Uncharacterized protein n=1 Tax=Apolygus lucorum TaxID=248454 RepID=A0A6A4IQV8_APOLU|nr:hypothetical protein GE061_007829 [Apolygus lucorum]
MNGTLGSGCFQDYYVKQFVRLNEFRDSDFMTDVTLVVGGLGNTYRAHKLVLSCHSQVFEAMFKNDMLESQRGEVVIDDVNPKIFSMFLDFVYTGDLPKDLTIQDGTELLVCADKYQTTAMLCALDDALAAKVTPQNALELRQVADSLNRVALKKKTSNIIWSNLAKTMDCETWKTMVSKNRDLMNELLLDFHKKVLKRHEEPLGSLRTSRNDLLHYSQSWNYGEGMLTFRPKGIKFTLKGKPVNFIAVYTRISTGTAVSLYPSTPLPGRILIHCKVTVRKDEQKEVIFEVQEQFLEWYENRVHPTLGHQRVEVMRWDWWDPEHTMVNLEVNASDGYARDSVVEGWQIDNTPFDPRPLVMDEPTEDDVFLCNGDQRVWIERSALPKTGEPYIWSFWRNRTEYELTDANKTAVETIYKYLKSGLYPPRDKVDLELLKVARTLRLLNLIIYIEQILTWELDPSNVVAIAKYSYDHGPNWLVWACAQYIKLHLDRIAIWDEEWKSFPLEFFEILCNEMREELYPCLLPKFLTTPRT